MRMLIFIAVPIVACLLLIMPRLVGKANTSKVELTKSRSDAPKIISPSLPAVKEDVKPPEVKTIEEPKLDMFVINRIKSVLLSEDDLDKARIMVLDLPQVQARIRTYGPSLQAETMLEGDRLFFFFRSGGAFLADSAYVDLKTWLAGFNEYQDRK